MIPKFKEAHPDCIKAASKFSDQYNKMIIESMGGSGDNDLEKEDKIIKKIAKEVVIDKENCYYTNHHHNFVEQKQLISWKLKFCIALLLHL